MLFHTSPIVHVEWDVLANKLYRTFYTPQPIHLDARIWNEDGNNKPVMLSFQPLPGATMDKLINGLLQFQRLPHRHPKNLHPEEV